MARFVFLGRLRAFGDGEDTALPPNVRTVSALLTWLGDRHPGFADAWAGMRAQVVINQTIVRDLMQPITDADEIAFLPPMSGG